MSLSLCLSLQYSVWVTISMVVCERCLYVLHFLTIYFGKISEQTIHLENPIPSPPTDIQMLSSFCQERCDINILIVKRDVT